MTRREWLEGGVLGAALGAEQPPAVEREQVARMVQALQRLALEATNANRGCSTGECGTATKIRDAFTLFFRSNQKFPDYLDVGVDVFYELYDWHVRNRQALNVTRLPDGRYGLGFMFTRLVLRPDVVPEFIGVPYDLRP
ncbi:MAG: hypothetical protein R2708_18725 [Vicinamibacterales bacterium]